MYYHRPGIISVWKKKIMAICLQKLLLVSSKPVVAKQTTKEWGKFLWIAEVLYVCGDKIS